MKVFLQLSSDNMRRHITGRQFDLWYLRLSNKEKDTITVEDIASEFFEGNIEKTLKFLRTEDTCFGTFNDYLGTEKRIIQSMKDLNNYILPEYHQKRKIVITETPSDAKLKYVKEPLSRYKIRKMKEALQEEEKKRELFLEREKNEK